MKSTEKSKKNEGLLQGYVKNDPVKEVFAFKALFFLPVPKTL